MRRPAALPMVAMVVAVWSGSAAEAWASVEATWEAVTLDVNGDPETIQGYHIHYGTQAGGPYPDGFSTGNVLTTVINNLAGGRTYYFVVTAIDVAGNESGYSNEASYTVPVEVCDDGQDNDGDGIIDCRDPDCASFPAPSCPLQDGVCAGSVRPCGSDGRWGQCTASTYGVNYESAESRCDGRDNDCDGQTDEMPGPACPLQAGVCRDARQPCAGASGWGECDYGADYQATEDRCDNLDNDCDGSVDEGCPCTPSETAPCSTDEGECVAGIQTCDAQGQWGPCSGVLPVTESCDGLDNDCDGRTDEELAPPACALQLGVCQGSAQRCGGTEGWLACAESDYGADYESEETRCDDLDNDCDGQTDEDGVCPVDGGDGGPDGGDAGSDAGTDGGGDAGADAAAGDGEVLIQGSCGCGAAGPSLVPVGAGLLVLMAWRRGRGSAGTPRSPRRPCGPPANKNP